MKKTTVTRKDYHGAWASKTQIELPDDHVLEISTSKKSSGVLSTTATVHKVEGSFMSHRMFQDYSKQLVAERVRVTEKAVVAQHNRAMEQLDSILVEVNAQYKFEQTAETV
jgi:hypothetical protein